MRCKLCVACVVVFLGGRSQLRADSNVGRPWRPIDECQSLGRDFEDICHEQEVQGPNTACKPFLVWVVIRAQSQGMF